MLLARARCSGAPPLPTRVVPMPTRHVPIRVACLTVLAVAVHAGSTRARGVMSDTVTFAAVSVPVAGGLSFSVVSTGFRQTCPLTATSVAYCWGLSRAGQLGDGTTSRDDCGTAG